MLFGIQPGPLLIKEQPNLVWGLIASFYVGNVLLLILNLPLAPVFALMLRFRYCFLYPGILVVSVLGAYSLQNELFGVWVVIVSAGIGLALTSFSYPAAPFILALVLGDPLETSLVQTSAMGSGDLTIFLHRPIALTLLILALASLVVPRLFALRKALIAKRTAAAISN